MNQRAKTRLWEQIAAIPAIERGTLTPHSSGRHLKLQAWQEGKNHTRHVSADELPAVQSALAGYSQYRQLTEQYADLVIQETRLNIAAAKKRIPPAPVLLAQEAEIQHLITRFESGELHGQSVAQLERLVRTAVFKSANALVGWLLQQAADRAGAGLRIHDLRFEFPIH